MEFTKVFRGYDEDEVSEYISRLEADYEDELAQKKDMITKLTEENINMKEKMRRLAEDIDEYKKRTESVGIAMIKAEEAAKVTIEEAEKKRQAEIERVAFETKKWEERSEEVRHQLIAFEEEIAQLLEKYQSEVSYLASKDVRKTFFANQTEMNDKTA